MSEKAKPESKQEARHPRGAPPPPEHSRWKPGQSGNPGGRPRVIADLQKLAQSHTEEAVETLVSVMKAKSAPPAARVAAAAHILDRGYGKPTQTVNATVERIGQLSDDELLAFLSRIDAGNGSEGAIEAEERPSLAM